MTDWGKNKANTKTGRVNAAPLFLTSTFAQSPQTPYICTAYRAHTQAEAYNPGGGAGSTKTHKKGVYFVTLCS